MAILNPWDVQSKHIHTVDGKASTLYAGDCRYGGGGEVYALTKIRHSPTDSTVTTKASGKRLCQPSEQVVEEINSRKCCVQGARNDIPESDRDSVTGSASGELQRSGRIQRYADNRGKAWKNT